MSETTRKACYDALNRLCKWRTVLAGWQLGTRLRGDAECDAVRDHREVTMLLRTELNAITSLLLQKKIFTEENFERAMTEEARAMEKGLEARFPGIRASDIGLDFDQRATDTMKDWML